MGKNRLGGNKSETKAKKKKSSGTKKTMAMEKANTRYKAKTKILKAAMPNKVEYEIALAKSSKPKKVIVGRAVVLAHGVGGSSSHKSMKAWKQRLAPLCDDVIMFDFPRPHQMTHLAAAYAEAILDAHSAGHRRIVLVGVGMGARTALHLLAGLPGDDGEPIEPLSSAVRESLLGVVALGYPLLRNGMTEIRDGAIRGLPMDAPPLMIVGGSNDPSASVSALEAALEVCAARTELRVIKGADAGVFGSQELPAPSHRNSLRNCWHHA